MSRQESKQTERCARRLRFFVVNRLKSAFPVLSSCLIAKVCVCECVVSGGKVEDCVFTEKKDGFLEEFCGGFASPI